MRKLLRAGYSRLFRDFFFLLAVAAMFSIGCVSALTQWRESTQGFVTDLSHNIFSYTVFSALAVGVVSAMCTGAEFDTGTIRNKLMVGHRRENVYLTQFLFMATAGVVCSLAYLVPYFTICRVALGPTSMPAAQLLSFGGMALCTVLAFAAVYNFVTMLIGKRAVAAVVCLLLFMGMIIVGSIIQSRLIEPELVSDYLLTVNGVEQTAPHANPRYIAPPVRAVWEWAYDLLPGGQCVQVAGTGAAHPLRLTLCALGEAAAFTLGGLLLFRRKDLK